MRCPMRSGPHQCDAEQGHTGPCETRAKEYAVTFDKPCSKCGKLIKEHRTEPHGLVCPE